jgi:hypothetical protein
MGGFIRAMLIVQHITLKITDLLTLKYMIKHLNDGDISIEKSRDTSKNNLSLIGVNSMLNLLSFDVRLNVSV